MYVYVYIYIGNMLKNSGVEVITGFAKMVSRVKQSKAEQSKVKQSKARACGCAGGCRVKLSKAE
jgi:hypothetical protein